VIQADRVRVARLGPDDVNETVSVLSESFFDYPVMRFVLGPEGDYDERLETLVTFFVMARVLRNEVLLGVRTADGLNAAALVSDRGGEESPPELGEVREETWAHLGADARLRYETFGMVTAGFEIEAPHIHLGMIGVRRAARGEGLGRVVLEAVHDLSASRTFSAGVSLTTEVESNVSLYEHFGYETVGSEPVESAFRTWGMFRRDPVGGLR
jgi:GNAT superfamily N-acetyltransferase